MLFSRRGLILLLLWLCNVSLFLSRTNISVAIIYMFPNNERLEGDLLSAFYVGYCFQTLAGWVAAQSQRPKSVLVCAVCAWSGATLLTSVVGLNVPLFFVLRAVVGVAEGCNYPCQMQLASVWIPHEERATAWAFMSTGESVGTILALLGGPFLVHAAGWPYVFVFSGGVGLVWVALFLALGASSPSSCRQITPRELEHIVASRPPRRAALRTPWCAFLRSRSFLGAPTPSNLGEWLGAWMPRISAPHTLTRLPAVAPGARTGAPGVVSAVVCSDRRDALLLQLVVLLQPIVD